MSPLLVLGVIALAVALYVIGVYNDLQTIKTRIVASIQEIGNQLKRQANLIPNLQESVKAYLKHEKDVYTMLTNARTAVDKAVKDKSMASAEKASNQIQSLLPKIQVLVESNPQLQANETIGQFMEELRDTADKLMYSRRTLIDLSQDFNVKLVTFPTNLVANAFGFQPEKGLETPLTGSHTKVSDKETKDVKVSL
ncbi:MAG: LemA family protein [Candidatus Pacebacteria bacterium]|nr:LemA family protein [Candidatus Paceibacterota bacterium]